MVPSEKLGTFSTSYPFVSTPCSEINMFIITGEISSKTNTCPISNTVLEMGYICKVIWWKYNQVDMYVDI